VGERVIPRLLVLGGGAVVRECYLPALTRLGWRKSVVIVESSPKSCATLRSQFPDVEIIEGEYQAVLGDCDVASLYDGAVIALPNFLHEDAVLRALRQGLPVLCEKPLAMNSKSCLQIASVAAEAAQPVMVGMVRRAIPTVRVIQEGLEEGIIGRLLSIDIEHGGRFSWPSDSGCYFVPENGGLLLNMGVHYLDMAECWLGPLFPRRYRDDYKGGVEANFEYELTAAGNVAVRIAASYTNTLRNTIVVNGSGGTLTADVDTVDHCTWESARTGLRGNIGLAASTRSGDQPFDLSSAFVEELVEFSKVIGGKALPAVDARQAASTAALIDWAVGNRQPIYGSPARCLSARRPSLAAGPTVVTGGTGFVGTKLVARLCELGFRDIRIPVRSYRSGAGVACLPVNRELADLLSYEQVKKAVRAARYVFHLAYGANGKDASRVTVEGTRNVVEAAIEIGVECVVVVSTTSVFGHTTTVGVVDESSPYKPDLGEYGRSKAKAEKYCLERARTSGRTRIVVLNPSSIYGPGGWLFTEFPARAAKAGQFCWIDEGIGKFNYTFVENFVDALLLAAQHANAHGERFIINDGTCSLREFLTLLLGRLADDLPAYTRQELVNRASARASLRDLVRAMANDSVRDVLNDMPVFRFAKRLASNHMEGLYEKARAAWRPRRNGTALQAERAYPPGWLADIFGPMQIECSAAKARKDLGWSPVVTLREGQELSVAWLQQVGLFESDESELIGADPVPAKSL